MGSFVNVVKSALFIAIVIMAMPILSSYAHAVTLGTPGTGRVSDTFRIRPVHPVTGATNVRHTGVDIAGAHGSPITATHGGTVVASGTVGGYGNYVRIQYADGTIATAYGHLDTIAVRVGDTVTAGQQIGTMGNTGGSTGTHLHYEVMVRHPTSGEMVYIDPQAAEGRDLSDPAVLDELIADGEAKLSGRNSVNNVSANNGGSGASAAQSCSAEILDTGKQLREASMNLEKGVIDQMVQKPQSVMELSCFDQFGEMFNQEIGKIFSDIDSSFQPLTNAFPGIFQDAQQSIVGEMSGALFGDRAQSFGSQISAQLSSAFSSIFGGGGGDVQYGCEVMETLWKVLQCEDIFNFDIPSLQDLIGGANFMEGLLPDSCSGKALFDGAMQAADRAFSDFGGTVPAQLQPSNIVNILSRY